VGRKYGIFKNPSGGFASGRSAFEATVNKQKRTFPFFSHPNLGRSGIHSVNCVCSTNRKVIHDQERTGGGGGKKIGRGRKSITRNPKNKPNQQKKKKKKPHPQPQTNQTHRRRLKKSSRSPQAWIVKSPLRDQRRIKSICGKGRKWDWKVFSRASKRGKNGQKLDGVWPPKVAIQADEARRHKGKEGT